jgi:endonuclease/exonuclease/phosphatase family metal-dependent hydrolase
MRINKSIILFLLIFVLAVVLTAFRKDKVNSTTTGLLTVITYNIGTFDGRRIRPEKIVATIRKNVAPDLLLLQEVPDVNFAIELAERFRLPFYLFGTYGAGKRGLAIISRYPLAGPEVIRFNGYAAFVVEMTVAGNCFLVSSVHLERVKKIPKKKGKFALSRNKAFALGMAEWFQNNPRSLAVDTLMKRLDKRACKYVIIGGDFNTFPFSTAIRKMGRKYDDALLKSKDYLSGTYKKLALPVQLRIDFIFHSRNIKCMEGSVIKKSDGDHFPVRATLFPRPD